LTSYLLLYGGVYLQFIALHNQQRGGRCAQRAIKPLLRPAGLQTMIGFATMFNKALTGDSGVNDSLFPVDEGVEKAESAESLVPNDSPSLIVLGPETTC